MKKKNTNVKIVAEKIDDRSFFGGLYFYVQWNDNGKPKQQKFMNLDTAVMYANYLESQK